MRWNLSVLAGLLLVVAACSAEQSPEAEGEAQSGIMPELAPVTLGCDEEIVVPEIKAEDEPPSSYEVILGVVALPTGDSSLEPLAVDPVPTSDSLDESLPSPQPSEGFWVKSGLLVRAGASVQMLVPQQLRDRMWIHWGYAGGDWTWDVTVPGCEGERAEWVLRDGETEWRVFAGGFWVKEPACVPLLVRSGTEEQQISIGVGAPCPGQDPLSES